MVEVGVLSSSSVARPKGSAKQGAGHGTILVMSSKGIMAAIVV